MMESCTKCGAMVDDHFGPGLCIHCFTGKPAATDPPADETETDPVSGRAVPCDMAPETEPEPDPDMCPEDCPYLRPAPAAVPELGAGEAYINPD